MDHGLVNKTFEIASTFPPSCNYRFKVTHRILQQQHNFFLLISNWYNWFSGEIFSFIFFKFCDLSEPVTSTLNLVSSWFFFSAKTLPLKQKSSVRIRVIGWVFISLCSQNIELLQKETQERK